MIERLKLFMDSYNLSSADLAEEIDVQRSGISHLLSGRNNPSLSFITKLLEHYPELSPDWLLFDKGAMVRSDYGTQSDIKPNLFSDNAFQESKHIEETLSPSKDGQNIEKENINEEISEKQPSIISIEEKNPNIEAKEVEKIVIFYSDRTFIEYKSR